MHKSKFERRSMLSIAALGVIAASGVTPATGFQKRDATRDAVPLMMRAAIAPNSFNSEKRTVEVIWSTGARGLRYDWDIGYYYEELSMSAEHVKLERLNTGASVLNSHQSRDLSAVIGSVVPGSASVDGKEGRATVQFSEREDVAPYVRDIEQGIIRFISVGYNVARYELVETGGEQYPVYRAVDWEPAEISFVPIPFDAGATVRSKDGEQVSKAVFINRSASAATNGGSMELTEEQKRIAAENEANARAEELRLAAERGRAEEAQRRSAIEVAANALPAESRAAFIAPMLNDVNVTAEQARAKIIEKLTADQAAIRNVQIETVEDETDKFIRGAANGIIARANLASQVEKTGVKVEAGEFRSMSLIDLARESLERRGVKTRGLSKMDLVARAFTHRAGNQTVSDFAILLENTMHKVLLAGFAVTPDTWSRFCAEGSVSDFRAHNRYRMGSFGGLESLNEAGEFKRKEIPDGAKESITAGTKGNIIGISRQAIINDDLTVFSRLLMMLGRAAKLSVEIDVYAALAQNGGLGPTLADGKTLFHADHKNVGTGSALSVAGLDADAVLMSQQKDLSGNEYLDIRPKSLLVPVGLRGQARVINEAQYDPDTANKLQKPNMVAGMFSDIVDSPRITGTRRYLFADVNEAPVLEVAFLDGQREPVLETQEGWNVDGTEMKVRYDYAVGAIGYEGAVTNAGV